MQKHRSLEEHSEGIHKHMALWKQTGCVNVAKLEFGFPELSSLSDSKLGLATREI